MVKTYLFGRKVEIKKYQFKIQSKTFPNQFPYAGLHKEFFFLSMTRKNYDNKIYIFNVNKTIQNLSLLFIFKRKKKEKRF